MDYLILILLSLGVIFFLIKKIFDIPSVNVKSKFDYNIYSVKNMSGSQDASDILAKLKFQGDDIIKNLENSFLKTRLTEKMKSMSLSETYNKILSETSFSISKKHVFMCLRNKENGELHKEFNTLLYVFLHELAHLGSVSLNHSKEFYINFSILLNKAIELNYFKEDLWKNRQSDYCGINIA